MSIALQTNRIYNNLGYWFLLFVLLAFVGFYKTYFSVLFESHPKVVHLHFGFMAIWMGIVIVQPFLIKYHKTSWHRTIGKISYFVVPLVIWTAIRISEFSYFSYKTDLETQVESGLSTYTEAEILHMCARDLGLPVFYILWLAIFYLLAIYHRKDRIPHSRYILACALTFIGPSLDRVFIFWFERYFIFGTFPIEYLAFAVINVILVVMWIIDKGNPKGRRTLGISLSIYLLGQILYATVRETQAWEMLITNMVNIGT